VSALRASTSFEVLIHGLTAAATKCRAFGAVQPNDGQGDSDM